MASGTPPFSYQWQKNGVDIKGGTGPSYTTPAAVIGDNGALFKCIVKNPVGNITSNAATMNVSTTAVAENGLTPERFCAGAELSESLQPVNNNRLRIAGRIIRAIDGREPPGRRNHAAGEFVSGRGGIIRCVLMRRIWPRASTSTGLPRGSSRKRRNFFWSADGPPHLEHTRIS